MELATVDLQSGTVVELSKAGLFCEISFLEYHALICIWPGKAMPLTSHIIISTTYCAQVSCLSIYASTILAITPRYFVPNSNGIALRDIINASTDRDLINPRSPPVRCNGK